MGIRILPKPPLRTDRASDVRARSPAYSPLNAPIFRKPGRPCEVCRHRERKLIDLSLLGGESSRSLAGRFGLSASSVKRHRLNCIPSTLILARQSEAIAEAEFLLARAAELDRKAAGVFEIARVTLDLRSAIGALGELRRLLSLQARLPATGRFPLTKIKTHRWIH